MPLKLMISALLIGAVRGGRAGGDSWNGDGRAQHMWRRRQSARSPPRDAVLTADSQQLPIELMEVHTRDLAPGSLESIKLSPGHDPTMIPTDPAELCRFLEDRFRGVVPEDEVKTLAICQTGH